MNSKSLVILFYGILMGTANKIPGVSGGLVAIAIGFYEKLVFSLKKFDNKAFQKIINFRFRDFFKYVNGSFLSLIFLGIIISYFSTSKILEIFLDKYEIYVWSLFFGLVIGTIFYIKKLVNFKSNINLLFIIVGISVGFIISLLDPANENDNLIFVFLCPGSISTVSPILAWPEETVPVTTVPKPLILNTRSTGSLKIPLDILAGTLAAIWINSSFNPSIPILLRAEILWMGEFSKNEPCTNS